MSHRGKGLLWVWVKEAWVQVLPTLRQHHAWPHPSRQGPFRAWAEPAVGKVNGNHSPRPPAGEEEQKGRGLFLGGQQGSREHRETRAVKSCLLVYRTQNSRPQTVWRGCRLCQACILVQQDPVQRGGDRGSKTTYSHKSAPAARSRRWKPCLWEHDVAAELNSAWEVRGTQPLFIISHVQICRCQLYMCIHAVRIHVLNTHIHVCVFCWAFLCFFKGGIGVLRTKLRTSLTFPWPAKDSTTVSSTVLGIEPGSCPS